MTDGPRRRPFHVSPDPRRPSPQPSPGGRGSQICRSRKMLWLIQRYWVETSLKPGLDTAYDDLAPNLIRGQPGRKPLEFREVCSPRSNNRECEVEICGSTPSPDRARHRGDGSKPFRERDEATGHLIWLPPDLHTLNPAHDGFRGGGQFALAIEGVGPTSVGPDLEKPGDRPE
jgi:hypothetical protein